MTVSPPARGLLDTSVLIARESGRPLDVDRLPDVSAISAITVGELEVGVLAARDVAVRSARLGTLELTAGLEVLPVDTSVARVWALLRAHLAEAGTKVRINDLWIAATACAHGIPVVSQDADFEPLVGVEGLEVIAV